MKKILVNLGFILTLSFGATVDDGLNAIEKHDYKKALTIFENLASKGDINAQYNLAVMYYSGIGVTKDYKKAFKLYEKAASQKDPTSQYNIGIMYDKGLGVTQDLEKAKEFYEKACNGGEKIGCEYYKQLSQEGF